MSRNIRTLIKGLADSPVIKEDWDITPITSTVTPDLVLSQPHNCVVSPQGVVVTDITGVTDSQYISVVKTNITMQGLETDKTIRFGYQLTDAPTATPFLVGIVIAPANRSATQIADELNATLFVRSPMSNNRILHYSLQYNSIYNAPTTYRIPTPATPNGVVGNFSNQVTIADFAVGSQSGMLLASRDNTLYIGRFDVNSDGVAYDLNGRAAVANGPAFEADMTVFYFAIVVDNGDGLQNVAYTPSLTVDSPGYNTVGTSAALAPTLVRPDWTKFANPVRPSYTQTVQAVLPTDVRIGQFYRVLINPSYTGTDPTPYGYPLKHNQTVLINSITGSGSITAYVDNESLITLTNDLLAPITQQQALLTQSMADFSVLLQQTNDDVNIALLNAPEVIAYVRAADYPLTGAKEAFNFATAVAFDTFDAAYTYLITLPRFIKKRIVFEDRSLTDTYYSGAESVTYHLMQHNIVLSTYSQMRRLVIVDYPLSQLVHLSADVSSLHVESFQGSWNYLTTPLPMRPFSSNEPDDVVPATDQFNGRLYIGNDCTFTMYSNAADFSAYGGVINVGDRSTLYFSIVDNIDLGVVQPLTFVKGRNALLGVYNNGGGVGPSGYPFVTVMCDYEVSQDQFSGFTPDQIYYQYRGIDPLSAQYPDAIIVRQRSQLGLPNYQGYFMLYQQKYVFAAPLDLEGYSLSVPDGVATTIQSAGDITISTNGVTALMVGGTCIDLGVHFQVIPTGGTVPVIASGGFYYRYGGRLTGSKLFSAYPSQYNSGVFHMYGVRHALWPSESQITVPSSVGALPDFQIHDLYLEQPLGNTALFTFNINTLDPNHKFIIDGVYGTDTYSTYGLVDIINGYGKASPDITETIVIKNIGLQTHGMANTRALVTRDGLAYDISSDPVFDYDARRLGFLLRKATGSAASSNPATPSSVDLNGGVYNEFGFYRDSNFPSLLRYRSRKHPRRFIYRLRANVYRTVGIGDAVVGVGFVNPDTNAITRNIETFTLATTNVRVPVEFVVIAESLLFNHQVVLLGCLTTSGNPLYFENIEFSIQET